MAKIQITTPGIRKALRRFEYPQAVAEYVWNGFDALANYIEIEYITNGIGGVKELTISDNGTGIPYDQLKNKFTPFFESEKELDPKARRTTSNVHGKNGVGRLTFFKFATHATWNTVFEEDGERYAYSITVTADALNSFIETEPVITNTPTGTSVTFSGIQSLVEENLVDTIYYFLAREFGWYLELNAAKAYSIRINGENLDYSDLINNREEFVEEINGIAFHLRYIQWRERLNREYSRYYFIDSKDNEKFKETTTLNNKGDLFYHSIYIQSDFFDQFEIVSTDTGDESEYQLALIGHVKGEDEFKELIEFVDRYLRDKRKPFLKNYTDKLIADFKESNAFPEFGKNEWDKYREAELEQIIRELYQIEPKIFSSLNTEQKKTFAHLLNLVMDEGEKDSLLEILEQIISLDQDDREQLALLLRKSSLTNIIKTIKLIEDRFLAVAELKELVFNKSLNAKEIPHIQNFIEDHYWIFGEQYHLVTAAEPKFEEALRRLIFFRTHEQRDVSIEHPDKQKEMDIFMVRQLHNDGLNNVVVELKHPKVSLGEKQLAQVKTYLNVIASTDEFNGNNMFWEFYLVGNKFDSKGYIEREIKNSRHHGEKSLVYAVDNHKIYVKTWSEVFADFELRHRFLLDKLELERNKLVDDYSSADEILAKQGKNTATMPA